MQVVFLFLVCAFYVMQVINLSANKSHYLKENVVFYAKKDACSNERIARKGILVKREGAKATVLILHGYGNNKCSVAPFRLFFKDYNCFTFDFRAHGEEIEEQCCTLGHDEIFDLFAAVDFVKSQPDLQKLPVLLWAPSMAASTAIEAVSIDNNLCSGMFLDSPFSSSMDILKKGIDRMKLAIMGYELDLPGTSFLEKYAFNSYVQPVLKFLLKQIAQLDATKIETFVKPIYPIESIKKVNIPCFFVICKNDEKIPVNSVKAIYKNHPGPKRLWIANGPDHCGIIFEDPERYEAILNEFFEDVISGDIYNKKREFIIQDPDMFIKFYQTKLK